MAMTLHVDIVSAERAIWSGTAEMVFVPLVNGEVGILPRHAPLLGRMRAGEVRVKPVGGGEELSFFVSGGMLEIQPHVVTVLAGLAIEAKDANEAAAQEAREHAEAALKDQKSEFDFAKATAELELAMAQIRALERLRKKGTH